MNYAQLAQYEMLERAGLVSRGKDAQRRPRKLEAKPLVEATEWLEAYRKFWEGRYQKLDALLDELKTMQKKPRKKVRNPAQSDRGIQLKMTAKSGSK